MSQIAAMTISGLGLLWSDSSPLLLYGVALGCGAGATSSAVAGLETVSVHLQASAKHNLA